MRITKLYKVTSDYYVIWRGDRVNLSKDGFYSEEEAMEYVKSFAETYTNLCSFLFEIVPYYELIK